MAMVDTVWGRLTRCNPPDDGSPEAASPGFVAAENEAETPKGSRRPFLLFAIAGLRWLTAAAVLALIAWAAMWEMGTSHYQAMLFSRLAHKMTFAVAPGAERGDPVSERRPL